MRDINIRYQKKLIKIIGDESGMLSTLGWIGTAILALLTIGKIK